MTRVLSELLGASEPAFSLRLRELEHSGGRPNADIRLSTEVLQSMQHKLRLWGLDPSDTKPQELYAFMGERLKADEERFATALRAASPKADDPIAHVAHSLQSVIVPAQCFALKGSVAKKLLKANLPKKTMKALGYRSADSMLKHETVASLYAAASLIENSQWMKKQQASYSKLKAIDFEIRKIVIEHPTAKRWQTLAESTVAASKHNILGFAELGSVVLLPLPGARPALITLTTTALAVHAVNDIRVASSYLRLHQVQPDFGAVVKRIVQSEAQIYSSHLDEPLAWSMVQQYVARHYHELQNELFEPVMAAEDFVWHTVEKVLAAIEPSLDLYDNTTYLAHNHEGQVVSCNLTDMLLSHCNNLPFESRISSYFKQSLLTELSLRYLQADRLTEAITSSMHKQLAAEPAAV